MAIKAKKDLQNDRRVMQVFHFDLVEKLPIRVHRDEFYRERGYEWYLPSPLILRRYVEQQERPDGRPGVISGYYSYNLQGMRVPGNPSFINAAKNDDAKDELTYRDNYGDEVNIPLDKALQCVYHCFLYSLPLIARQSESNIESPIVCLVPRAEREECYYENQLGIKLMLQRAIRDVQNMYPELGLEDGVDCIQRIRNMPTTHAKGRSLPRKMIQTIEENLIQEEDFMLKSCSFDESKIKGRDVILVDDVYTRGVRIVEGAIIGLLKAGASNIAVYTIGGTNLGTQHEEIK